MSVYSCKCSLAKKDEVWEKSFDHPKHPDDYEWGLDDFNHTIRYSQYKQENNNGWTIDHITSKKLGRDNGWTKAQICSIDNLRPLFWEYNRDKGSAGKNWRP